MVRKLTPLFIAVLLLTACKKKDDEALIRALIDEAASLAEQHETSKLMDLTTDNFTADPGGRSAEEARQVLQFAFMRYGDFGIIHPRASIDVDPNGEQATAELPFLIIREGFVRPDLGGLVDDPEGWVEEASRDADPYHIKISFWKEGGDWKVDRVHMSGVRGVEGL